MNQLLINANIYKHPKADTLYIEGNRIGNIGTFKDLFPKYPTARIIDLHNSWVYPGFHDTHLHLVMTGQALSSANLTEVKSIQELQDALREQKGNVIHGMGWDQEKLLEKRMPTCKDLDEVSLDRPIIAERYCTHVLTANTCAMEKAGIWSADGIFKEDDCLPFMPLLAEDEQNFIDLAIEHCLKRGLTCIQPADLKTGNFNDRLGLYEKSPHKIRIYHQVNITELEKMDEFESKADKIDSDIHSFGPYKGFADGSLGARTAWMINDYADDPGNRGICTMNTQEMDAFVAECKRRNKQVVFHAIGDQAILQILDTFKKYQDPENSLRWGILHVQITDQNILDRFKEQKILAYVQPVFWRSDKAILNDRVLPELAKTSYAFGTLYRDTHISMGTDSPIEDCDAIDNLYWATHCPNAMTMDEAIDAYTSKAAYSAFMENELGQIKPDYLADLTFTDREISEDFNPLPRVINTMVDGELTHEFEWKED